MQVEKREILKRRIEYTVRTPCAWKDVNDALTLALGDLSGRVFDDSYLVETRDEMIVVYREEEITDADRHPEER